MAIVIDQHTLFWITIKFSPGIYENTIALQLSLTIVILILRVKLANVGHGARLLAAVKDKNFSGRQAGESL